MHTHIPHRHGNLPIPEIHKFDRAFGNDVLAERTCGEREPTPVFGSPRVDYGIRQNSTQGHRVHQNKYIFAYPLTKFGTHGAAEELLG